MPITRLSLICRTTVFSVNGRRSPQIPARGRRCYLRGHDAVPVAKRNRVMLPTALTLARQHMKAARLAIIGRPLKVVLATLRPPTSRER